VNTIPSLILACSAALLVSCSRESEGPPATAIPATAPASPRGPAKASEAPAAAAVIPDSGDSNATLQRLTQALRDHVVRTRTVPKDFDDFAAKSRTSFPPPPDGKKYEIRGQEVVLVNR